MHLAIINLLEYMRIEMFNTKIEDNLLCTLWILKKSERHLDSD